MSRLLCMTAAVFALVVADGAEDERNPPNSWVYFDSKESLGGRPPRLELKFAKDEQTVPVAADTALISYLADRVWGGLPTLSISMNDTNRVLVRFDLTSLKSAGAVQQAELVLEMHNSEVPVIAPFELAAHAVTERWGEATTNWGNQPTFRKKPIVTLRVAPAEQTLRIDVSPIVQRWLKGTTRNHGLLLKVAAPPGGVAGPEAGGAVPELPLPPAEAAAAEKLPWPHQAPGLSVDQMEKLNNEVWIINNFPLYQADEPGTQRYFHSGLDIVLPNGTPIYALKDGWVKSIDGSTTVIADRQDATACYGWAYTHLGSVQVKPGDFVKVGTHIGNVDFHGLAHIHLEKAWSAGEHWGACRYACLPDAHFTYVDREPPVIRSPFLFFENDTDEPFTPDESGQIVLRGEVDIVVGLRDAGTHARSRESGFGDRLAVAAIDYEIRPADREDAAAQRFHSFDFRRLPIKHSVQNGQFNTALTKVVYKHWALCEAGARTGDKTFSYYVVTNCPGRQPPTELRLSDARCCWNTAAVDDRGGRVYPDGPYVVVVHAGDSAGNQSSARTRVIVSQAPAH